MIIPELSRSPPVQAMLTDLTLMLAALQPRTAGISLYAQARETPLLPMAIMLVVSSGIILMVLSTTAAARVLSGILGDPADVSAVLQVGF